MKQRYITFIFHKAVETKCLLIAFILLCLTSSAEHNSQYGLPVQDQLQTISNTDTIFIDLNQATFQAGQLIFPVYIETDDPITSMDFQFFFNDAAFSFNAVTNLAGLDQVLGFVNFDSQQGAQEFRFTSNTFPETYPVGSNLVLLSLIQLQVTFAI